MQSTLHVHVYVYSSPLMILVLKLKATCGVPHLLSEAMRLSEGFSYAPTNHWLSYIVETKSVLSFSPNSPQDMNQGDMRQGVN